MAMLQRVVPHSVIPGVLTPIFQEVPYKEMLAEETRFGILGDDFIYQPTVTRINTPTTVGQQWRGNPDSVSYSIGQISVPYYTVMARQEFDPNEQAKFERIIPGTSLNNFLGLLCQQAIWQRIHYACCFGFDTVASQGIVLQGLLDNIPADSSGNTHIMDYDPTELVQTLANTARAIMDATYGMAKPVVVWSTLEMINYLRTLIIPLVSSQKPGSGVDSAGGLYSRIIGEWLGVGKVMWIADNAAAGKGAAGTDLISFIAPGLSKQESEKVQKENTNIVAESMPQNMRNTLMDAVGGLVEFQNPIMNGISSKLWSEQITPGVLLRPEAVSTLEFVFAAE